MKEESDKPIGHAPASKEISQAKLSRKSVARKMAILAVVALVAIVVVAIFLFRPRQSGKPVPAPRTISFGGTPDETVVTNEQKLTLTPEQVRSAGLKIEAVGERPTSEAAGQKTTGTIQPNAYKETPVVSLVGGIVLTVSAELGESVGKGQTIAIVFSNELADAQSRYLTALAALDEHHRHHLRTVKLVEIGAASREDLEMANSQYREAESNVANLRQKLLLLGMSAQRINALKSTSQVGSEVSVRSPSSGTVTSRTVNPGEVIEANKEMMRVTDLSTIWVVGQVYEKDLATVRVGSGAIIMSDAYPGRIFRGSVAYVDPKIDPATRTAQVRIELPNPGQIFKIGMYVNVAFGALGIAKTTTVVPKDSVQIIGNQQFVFVATANANEFILRAVRLGAESDGFYPVLEGLSADDRIVVNGSFLLRAEWMKLHPIQ